ncbi:MAG: colanic acid exporter [Euryarchaeota archaeon ADurb.Bin009]|jgi:lipopolysaccharide exporter|nr:MAG: colanic acid exporter [Euryarchaeota archaeon ADurb.Bin009]
MPGFFSNVFKLATGTMLAQVAGITLIPVVTRIYSPECLGVLQLFLSIATVIVIVSSLSYNLAVMLPEKDEDSINIFVLSIMCVTGISVATGAVVVGFADRIGEIFTTAAIADYLIWLPVFVILSGFSLILNEWLSRKVKYGVLSRSIVVSSISTRIFQIGGGLMTASPLGLILGSVMGLALANFFMFRGLKEDIGLLKAVTVQRMKDLAIRYREFSLFGTAASLANSMSWELPAFMLGLFFSSTILGYYALAMMAVRVPMMMVGTAVSQVFFQKASEEMNLTGGVQTVVQEIHTRLISISIFPFVIFIVLSEGLFTFIFGANWLIAGTYARILAPWLFAVFIISPISSLFGVMERQKAYLFFESVTLCTWALIFFIGGTSGDPIFTLALFSICGMLIWGSKSMYLIKASGAGYRGSAESLARHLLLSIIVSLPLIFGVYMGLAFLFLLGIAGITAIVYYLTIFFTDALIQREIKELAIGFFRPEHIDLIKRLSLFRYWN